MTLPIVPLLAAGAVLLFVLVAVIVRAWWQRFKLRRIAEWTAAALLSLASAPDALLERRVRGNVARVLGLPVHLVRIVREKGGAVIRIVLCGPAVEQADRFQKPARTLLAILRRFLPPWSEVRIDADPKDPGVPIAPVSLDP